MSSYRRLKKRWKKEAEADPEAGQFLLHKGRIYFWDGPGLLNLLFKRTYAQDILETVPTFSILQSKIK